MSNFSELFWPELHKRGRRAIARKEVEVAKEIVKALGTRNSDKAKAARKELQDKLKMLMKKRSKAPKKKRAVQAKERSPKKIMDQQSSTDLREVSTPNGWKAFRLPCPSF